jgi:hypothetical protein
LLGGSQAPTLRLVGLDQHPTQPITTSSRSSLSATACRIPWSAATGRTTPQTDQAISNQTSIVNWLRRPSRCIAQTSPSIPHTALWFLSLCNHLHHRTPSHVLTLRLQPQVKRGDRLPPGPASQLPAPRSPLAPRSLPSGATPQPDTPISRRDQPGPRLPPWNLSCPSPAGPSASSAG